MARLRAGDDLLLKNIAAAFQSDLLDKFCEVSSVGAAESTTQNFFTDMTTVGPQVTLKSKGTRALVWISCRSWAPSSVSHQNLMGVSVSNDQGEVVPPSQTAALIQNGTTVQTTGRAKGILVPINIAPGTYTYTAQYRSGVSGTASHFDRRVMVVFAP